MQMLLELLRKWVTGRGLPWVCFWVREYCRNPGEHWHIALHLPDAYRADLAAQVAIWMGEDIDPSADLKRHDVAVSQHRSWKLTGAKRHGGGPEGLAAYLGKAEPNHIRLHGKTKQNPDKADRRYLGGLGPIQGKRFYISTTIGATAQERAGWTP